MKPTAPGEPIWGHCWGSKCLQNELNACANGGYRKAGNHLWYPGNTCGEPSELIWRTGEPIRGILPTLPTTTPCYHGRARRVGERVHRMPFHQGGTIELIYLIPTGLHFSCLIIHFQVRIMLIYLFTAAWPTLIVNSFMFYFSGSREVAYLFIYYCGLVDCSFLYSLLWPGGVPIYLFCYYPRCLAWSSMIYSEFRSAVSCHNRIPSK